MFLAIVSIGITSYQWFENPCAVINPKIKIWIQVAMFLCMINLVVIIITFSTNISEWIMFSTTLLALVAVSGAFLVARKCGETSLVIWGVGEATLLLMSALTLYLAYKIQIFGKIKLDKIKPLSKPIQNPIQFNARDTLDSDNQKYMERLQGQINDSDYGFSKNFNSNFNDVSIDDAEPLDEYQSYLLLNSVLQRDSQNAKARPAILEMVKNKQSSSFVKPIERNYDYSGGDEDELEDSNDIMPRNFIMR